MNEEQWIILDTETTGLSEPISVVEIAAQKMRGWERDGEPFRVLLNHDVPIEPQAEALHGYSRDYLRQYGEPPLKAHAAFAAYAGQLPVVAYNLGFDWNRALAPEYARLGITGGGSRGFCAMTLARRTVKDVINYKLDTLKEAFALSISQSHRGRSDVETLVRLWEGHLAPALFGAGILGFPRISEFSRETTVAKCQQVIFGEGDPVWFYLDGGNNTHGPVRPSVIKELKKSGHVQYVFREGMTEWALVDDVPDFAPPAEKTRRKPRKVKFTQEAKVSSPLPVPSPSSPEKEPAWKPHFERWTNELVGICRGIVADGEINSAEFTELANWLQECPCTHLYPMSAVSEQIEAILEDGVVTSEELDGLKRYLESILPA